MESVPTEEDEPDLAFAVQQLTMRRTSHPRRCNVRGCDIIVCQVVHNDEYQDDLETFSFNKHSSECMSNQPLGDMGSATFGQVPEIAPCVAQVSLQTCEGQHEVVNNGEGWIQTHDFPALPVLLSDNKFAHSEDELPDGHMNISVSSVVCGMIPPTLDELLAYRGDGTYVDVHRQVHKSRHIQQVNADMHLAQLQAVQDGKDFVVHVPKGIKQAFNEEEYGPYWRTATHVEMVGLFNMRCFSLKKLNDPKVVAVGTIPSHFVFSAKWTSDVPPVFSKFKARLVAGGNFETPTDNPYENFSPTAGAISNRFFDAYCTYRGYHIRTTDMTQAFLNSDAVRDIYVRLPKGMPNYHTHCFKLLKMLYGLRASPKAWMDTLTAVLTKKLGFQVCPEDPCLLKRIDDDGDEIVVEVYVDDCKWGSASIDKLDKVIAELATHFTLTDEKGINTYLGLRYQQSTDADGMRVLKVDQTAYIDSMVERFGLCDSIQYPACKTPLPCLNSRSLEEALGKIQPEDTEWANTHGYAVIIGSLIHAMVHTRPDIAYAVSILSRAMSNPDPYHWKGAQMVLRYLRDTRELGIVHRQSEMIRQEKSFLTAAVDSSFADCDTTARSTSGYVIWFGGSPLEYECKRQPLVTMSTCESEYVAASKCVNGIKALDKLLTWFGLKSDNPTIVHEDNSACIAVAANPVHKSRTRHIAIRYHNVRDACLDKTVFLQQVWTGHQVADIFTKALKPADFVRFRGPLMGSVTFDEMVEQYPKPLTVSSSCYPDVSPIMYNGGCYAEKNERRWPRKVIPLQPRQLIEWMMRPDGIAE